MTVFTFIGFYKKFIPFFADITACLNMMLRKGATFSWAPQCETAFKLLKAELVKIPSLQYPNQNKLLKLFTDALNTFIEEYCIKKKYKNPEAETNLIPIAYFSGSFGRTQQLWNTTQKKCYVVYHLVRSLLFIYQIHSVDCIVTTNH